tara:strand:- start:360 stop:668 length:309 start_codon:yes stop_codon:yes gene_type:complete
MTDINIEDYINYINNNNNIKGEKCMVCHMNDTLDNLVKLNCNHYFHKTCLPKKNIIKCLYCNKKTKLKSSKTVNNNKCNVILKSGKNKGKVCNRINCGYHKN